MTPSVAKTATAPSRADPITTATALDEKTLSRWGTKVSQLAREPLAYSAPMKDAPARKPANIARYAAVVPPL